MSDHTRYAEMLAVYALGALDAAEESELQDHLRSCTECQTELAALRGDAALLALSAVGPAPPLRARQRLLATISNEARQQPVLPRLILGTLRPGWLSFAPIAAALILAVFSLMLWRLDARLQRRLDQTQAELQRDAKLQRQLEQTQAELEQTQEQLHKSAELVALLHSPDSMHLTLVKVRTSPQPQIKTVYSPKMGRLLLMASHLDPLPQNKAYELWLLPMNGAPMPCGMFKPNAKGDAMMDHSLSGLGIEAKGFAITIEPESGSATPTSPIEMISVG